MRSGRAVGVLLVAFLVVAAMEAPAAEAPKRIRPEQYQARIVAPRKGRILAVHFWATWCEPCREELPDLVAGAAPFQSRDLAVVLVSLDTKRTAADDVAKYLSSAKIPFVSFLMKTHDPRLFFRAVDPDWPGTIPLTIVYGRDSKMTAKLSGRQSREAVEAALRSAIGAGTAR